MIIVTGATGQLGRRIVEHLLTRVPAEQVGVSVRDPGSPRARTFADRGVRVRRGDFADAGSLAHAFEGASQVLVVSVDKLGEECVKQHRTAIEAAVGGGGGGGGGPAPPPPGGGGRPPRPRPPPPPPPPRRRR
ncbi:NmrA family NAD(P)-binding protein, partial [Streptomyces tendae]